MATRVSRWRLALSFFPWLILCGVVVADDVTVEAVMRIQPVQKDVPCDRPDAAELAKCTLKANKREWIVRDSAGQILRRFVDTDGDGIVDQFSYYRDGVEIYRDVDSDADKKADQYRWLNTAGIRWGIDKNQDTKIDYWRAISPEEVTAEAVAALKDRDRARYERLLLTPKELNNLGLGAAKKEAIGKRIEGALANFTALANQKGAITPDTKWVSFGATQPGTVPAGTDESTADLTVYENVVAMIESGGNTRALTVGAMIKVGDTWRLVDAPLLTDDKNIDLESRYVFFSHQRDDSGATALSKPTARMQELIEMVQKLPDSEFGKKAEILESLAKEAETPELRESFYKQVADTLNAATVQPNTYKSAIERLRALEERLKADPKDEELAFYAQWRRMTAEHGNTVSTGNPDQFAKIQSQWVEDVEQFVKEAQKYPDSVDAVFELAISQEFSGDEDKAIKWYDTIVRQFPSSPVSKKAHGAKTRLTSLGRNIQLAGKTTDGKAFDLSTHGKGKIVLIQYWATWAEVSKVEMPLLRDLAAKYSKDLQVVGVCMDTNRSEMMAYLKENPPKWPQLHEEGGLDGRFGNEMGVHTLPLMILIDKQGKVVNRNIRATELDSEIKKLLSAK